MAIERVMSARRMCSDVSRRWNEHAMMALLMSTK